MPLAESQGSDGWEGLKEVKSQGAELHWQIKKKEREERRRERRKKEKKRKKDRNMILVFNHMG